MHGGNILELLIKIKSRHCKDRKLDAQRLHAGDVIAAKPDGWAWSVRERENPEWVIVRAPITEVEAQALIAMEFDPLHRRPFVYSRQRTLDLKALNIKQSNEVIEVDKKSLSGVTQDKGTASGN